MGLMARIEQALERVINTGFARAFKSELVPAEIAAAVRSECDATVVRGGRGQQVASNDYVIRLSSDDFEHYSARHKELTDHVASDLLDHVRRQRYMLPGPPDIRLERAADLPVGMCKVVGSAVAVAPRDVPDRAPFAPVQPWVEVNGARVELRGPVTVIGRNPDSGIRIAESAVSGRHAEIRLGTPCLIVDLGSTNGTVVDGRRIARAELRDGSRIVVGTTTLVFRGGPR